MQKTTADKYSDIQIRGALGGGDFEAARRAVERYGRDVRAEAEAERDPAARAALVDRALASLRDHLHLARVIRAHLASQLKIVSGASRYQVASSRSSTLDVEG